MADENVEKVEVEPMSKTCDEQMDGKLKDYCKKIVAYAEKNFEVDGLAEFVEKQVATEEFLKTMQDTVQERDFADDSSLVIWAMKQLMSLDTFNQILARDYFGKEGGLAELLQLYLVFYYTASTIFSKSSLANCNFVVSFPIPSSSWLL